MNKDYVEQVNSLIQSVCSNLHIPIPEVSYFTSEHRNSIASTTYDANNNTFLLKIDCNVEDIRDTFFFVLHEIRHIWQRTTDSKKYFDNYAQVFEVGEYNYYSQFAEIDANAFALAMMKILFNLIPKVSSLPKDILDIVLVREKKIRMDWKQRI